MDGAQIHLLGNIRLLAAEIRSSDYCPMMDPNWIDALVILLLLTAGVFLGRYLQKKWSTG